MSALIRMNQDLEASFLARTKILKAPKHVLSTFGATRIDYSIVSPIDGSGRRARLRSGHMTSAKPLVLTPEALRERFQGFGPEERPVMDWILSRYGESLRGLEYVFKNSGFQARVLSLDPDVLAERIKADFESRESANGALILCPDSGWSLALMKFSIDEALRSFPTHVRDLDRRGRFK